MSALRGKLLFKPIVASDKIDISSKSTVVQSQVLLKGGETRGELLCCRGHSFSLVIFTTNCYNVVACVGTLASPCRNPIFHSFVPCLSRVLSGIRQLLSFRHT